MLLLSEIMSDGGQMTSFTIRKYIKHINQLIKGDNEFLFTYSQPVPYIPFYYYTPINVWAR